MTQRIFDTDNEEDMKLLWSILPDNIIKAEVGCGEIILITDDGIHYHIGNFIAINWHDKTEITRPVNYEDMIGCVVYFYDEPEYKTLGILKSEIDGRTFIDELGGVWDYIEPAKKSELKFYGE